MANILVTDGSQRASLAVVRSLGAAGHRVFVSSSEPRSLAGSSRHCRADARTASPLVAPEQFVADVERLLARWHIEILLPITEPSAHGILGAPERFNDVIVPMPKHQSFTRICRKPLVLEAAEKLGIRVPRQKILAGQPDPAEVSSLAQVLPLPLVAKPSSSVVSDGQSQRKADVYYADNQPDLLRVMDELPPGAYPLMLQERIRGSGIGVFLLLWQGEVLASFGHRRIRERPPSGGASVDRESVAVPPDLLQKSVELLRAFDWQGVAMVEYKMDVVSGTPVLMEVNGRFWGSLQLAIDAGVDFPALLVDAAMGRPRAPVTRYRTGVRSRWFWGDVDQLLRRLRHSAEELHLQEETPRTRALVEFARASWQTRSEVFRLSDPAPGLLESWEWIRKRSASRLPTRTR